MLLVRYVRVGLMSALKLKELLRWDTCLMNLAMEDVALLDQMFRSMHEVYMENGMLFSGKLLQCMVEEDEEADKAAAKNKPDWEDDARECFRAARWYATNGKYPSNGSSPTVWEYWASFDPPVSDVIPRNVQCFVVWGSSLAMLKRLITLPGWDLDNSLSPCCVRGMPKHAALLLKEGANANALGYDGESVLTVATISGSREVVELLLKHGADVHARDAHGRTALSWASTYTGRKEMVELLKEHGAR